MFVVFILISILVILFTKTMSIKVRSPGWKAMYIKKKKTKSINGNIIEHSLGELCQLELQGAFTL